MVGAELLLAYVTKDRQSLHYYFGVLQRNREQWYAWADEAGTRNNPWVRALIECTAVQLIDAKDLEKELRADIDSEREVPSEVSILWSNEEIKKRRQRIESWLEESKSGPYEKTHSFQLSRLADILKEEALRTHDSEMLSRSLDLTRQFRVLEKIELETISYHKLDLRHPSSEMFLTLESILALACADRRGIQHLLKLLKRSASACAADNDSCGSEVLWIDELMEALAYGMQRWNVDKSVQSEVAEAESHAGAGRWMDPKTHAIWLRWEVQDLPADGQSFCPSRVPWIE